MSEQEPRIWHGGARRMHNMRKDTLDPAERPAEVPRGQNTPGRDQALELGPAVIPVIAKAYWKQAAGVLLALAVVRRLRRG